MENEHDIDHLFKRGLSDPEIPFDEMDWNKMELLLDRKKNRVVPLWWYLIGGVAAVFLLLLSGIFRDYAPVKNNTVQVAKKPVGLENRQLPKVNGSGTMASNAPAKGNAPTNLKENILAVDTQATYLSVGNTLSAILQPDKSLLSSAGEIGQGNLRNNTNDSVAFDGTLAAITLNSPDASALQQDNAQPEQKVRLKHAKNQGLVMSILVAPDVSSAKMNVSSKLSSNFGVSVSYPITKRLSLTSGVVYAKKYYNSAGFGTPGTAYLNKAWQINADCSVLDIPINVNYKVFQRSAFSIAVNTGLSSYFMLNEKYDFLVGTDASQRVSQIEFSNQNKHLLGVANFSISFERRLTRNLSFGVQPFVKLPLTGIGQYDSRLKSTGMSFSLNIGLFRPKNKD